MALYDDYLAQNKSLLDYFGGLKGTSTGLSPETQAGLRTMALESVPAKFERTESELATRLLRQNPSGLPQGGEFLRAYAPLEIAKEQTTAGLLRDLMLENEAEKRRTLDVNNQLAFRSADAYGNLGTTLLGEDRAQGRFEAGQALTREQAGLDRNLARELAELERQGAPFGTLLGTSLLSTALSPEGGNLLGRGIDALAGLFGGGGKGGALDPGRLGDIMLGGGGTVGGEAATSGGFGGSLIGKGATAAGKGFTALGEGIASGTKSLIGAVGSLPVAGQIALAAAGAFFLGKKVFGIGNTHEKADEWVQEEQNKFDGVMRTIDQRVQAGSMDEAAAVQARTRAIREYVEAGREFAAKGKDQRRVIDQAFETLRRYYGPQLQQAMVAGYLDVPQQFTAQGWF